MKRKKLVMILVCILVVLIAVAAVVAMKKGGNSNGNNTGSEQEELATNGLPVETKYGTLYISDQWYDYFEYEINEEEGYVVEFNANFDGVEAKLFKVIFGSDKEDSLLGYIEHEGEQISVHMIMDEMELPADFPEEKTDAFYAMQEEINSIIEQLEQMDNFKPVE